MDVARGLGTVAVMAAVACGPAAESPPARPAIATTAAVSNVAALASARRCPPPPADRLESAGAPWERDPLGAMPACIETADGATVEVIADKSDLDGWRAELVVTDDAGVRYRRPTRAIMSMAVAPDGGVVLSHTEDYVERFTAAGGLAWSAPRPKCGYAETAVAADGRVVLACGYSYVAYAPDGTLLWQRWPFGNARVGTPLIARDGTIVTRSGATVAGLDATGAIAWRVDTGANRFVRPLGVARDGSIVFVTSMAELHSEGDVHIYYETQPDELFAITARGRVLSRRTLDGAPAWPDAKPWTPGLRSGRIE